MNFKLYVGMNKKSGGKVSESNFINVLNNCCKDNNITGYSVFNLTGYYTYDNGSTTIEKSKAVLLIGVERSTVLRMIEYLKKELFQESIMLESVVNNFEFI